MKEPQSFHVLRRTTNDRAWQTLDITKRFGKADKRQAIWLFPFVWATKVFFRLKQISRFDHFTTTKEHNRCRE